MVNFLLALPDSYNIEIDKARFEYLGRDNGKKGAGDCSFILLCW